MLQPFLFNDINPLKAEAMEEKLVTLAILTYSKAQILKNVLENEGIEACIHNVNLIQPVISSGVRIRIRESDLPRALKIIESSTWLAEDVVNEEKTEEKHGKQILVPVDFPIIQWLRVSLDSILLLRFKRR